jgi:N-acetylneuraminate synthase
MKIGNREIGQHIAPLVIAEMSGNHNHSLERAFEIVDAAAASGAHALKLQTLNPDTITLDVKDGDFFISDEQSLWKGHSLHELYRSAYTPWEWHEPIMDRAKKLGMLCFSTPFDESAVDFLESLNVPAYKIASAENTDLPLIRKVASKGKPIIVSTGMATLAELDEMVRTIRSAHCDQLVLLKCNSAYPSPPDECNVLTIPNLRKLFGCEVGLSDHTMGIGVAVAAVSHGASVIEKHFTVCRADGGVDAAFSLEPEEVKQLVLETKRAWQALGKVYYGPTETEKATLKFRRSVYIAEDMRKGERFDKNNLRVVRPGRGLPPKYFDMLLGRKVNRDVKKGTAIKWELID